uniref:Uncharacterized protein n=1 Tax=Brassica oleracea TaxID=3712 RepID=A0A3P6C9P3_BRAOL|nr:unnamed protein product [Brassica oleracea]
MMTMAILALCVSSLSIYITSSCTQLIFFACDQRLALFFSFLSVSSSLSVSSLLLLQSTTTKHLHLLLYTVERRRPCAYSKAGGMIWIVLAI